MTKAVNARINFPDGAYMFGAGQSSSTWYKHLKGQVFTSGGLTSFCYTDRAGNPPDVTLVFRRLGSSEEQMPGYFLTGYKVGDVIIKIGVAGEEGQGWCDYVTEVTSDSECKVESKTDMFFPSQTPLRFHWDGKIIPWRFDLYLTSNSDIYTVDVNVSFP